MSVSDDDIECGELPLRVLSDNEGSVAVYDAKGAEVVPYSPEDWEAEVLLTVPSMASVLKQAYEEPKALLKTNASWMKDQYEGERGMWTQGDEGPYWFDPDPLPSAPVDVDEDDFDAELPLEVIVHDDAQWPDDPEVPPAHEVRIEDVDGTTVYRMTADEYAEGVEPVSDLVKAIRLAYEEPLALLGRTTN